MATMRGLRRQIRELENELNRLSQERQDYLNAAEENYRRSLEQTEQQMQQMRAAEVQENRVRYQTLRQELLQAHEDAMREIQREADAAARQRQQLLAELQQAHRELEAEKNRLIQECQQEKQKAKSAAQMLGRKAREELNRTAAAPHEFFFPGQMELLESRIAQMEQSMQMEMYQAAASIAATAASEAELLGIRTQQKLAEWEEMFRDYELMVRILRQRQRVFETTPLETAAGSFVLARRECDFWSLGEYGTVADEISQAAELVGKLQHGSLVQVLKAGALPKGYTLLKSLKEISKVGQTYAAVTECIVRERAASDERFLAADQIVQMLEEYGFTRVEGGFAAGTQTWRSDTQDMQAASASDAQSMQAAAGQENPMDSFLLTVRINAWDRIEICITPRREHGVSIENKCLVTLEIETVPDPKLIAELLALYAQRIREATGLMVEEIGEGQEALQQREHMLKRRPDIKKYQEFRQRHAGKEIA